MDRKGCRDTQEDPMSGWATVEEAWADARKIAESCGASDDDLLAAGRLYIESEWQEGDPDSVMDVIEAVVVMDRLLILPKYLEASVAMKETEAAQ